MLSAGLTDASRQQDLQRRRVDRPGGQLLLKHRKINLLDIEQDLYATGDRLQVVAGPACGVLGVNICADNFPDSLALGHAIGRMGAQILLSPSAWAVPADHDPRREPYGSLWEGAYSVLARLYEMPVVGVSNVGPDHRRSLARSEVHRLFVGGGRRGRNPRQGPVRRRCRGIILGRNRADAAARHRHRDRADVASQGLRRAVRRCPTMNYRFPTYPAHSVCRFFRRHTECAGYYSGNLLFRSAKDRPRGGLSPSGMHGWGRGAFFATAFLQGPARVSEKKAPRPHGQEILPHTRARPA